MLATIGVLAFIFALLLSVMLHELGHFLFAKRFGMKVTEFFLGFGKRLWSFTKGETEFGIKAIPAGGYCRIVGMSAREELAVEDSDRAFYKASVGKRLVVLGAGSALHFIFGFVLLFTLFCRCRDCCSYPQGGVSRRLLHNDQWKVPIEYSDPASKDGGDSRWR
jgi:RIP metalloprotease RseP